MRLIVTGGGTGGHIYPALAIADKFKEMDPETEILYIGNVEGIEKDVVPKSGYPLKLVDARWLDHVTPKQVVWTGARVTHGIGQSLKVLRQFKPDAIIGTGGYVCFPVLLASRFIKCRKYLHEQNAYPGLANRTLEKYVDNIFLGFADAGQYFKYPDKHIEAGNPVRKSFFTMSKREARERLGIPQDDFVVFTFGGSLGAAKINGVACELLELFNGHPGVSMIMGTGKLYYDEIMKDIKSRSINVKENIRIKDYIDNMDLHLMACDLVISRAGALSVAETTVCGKAAILVPSPNVTGNHQYYNAKAVADRGGALLIEEKDLVIEDVVQDVLSLRNNPDKLKGMSKASRESAPDKALDIIYNKVYSNYIADRNKKK
ncbi:MAG: undecaprenyldiphospho-muramoylpentapeptide beta-N-acetylglucosaminyltransferase [Firmicutes bacterium]|jgi:UDP-N-acetylglucosamine--N-acetylmuramyl-(pentapeptide) pyrophosphoryl-undecaprenol N-acetylglucosamine transferase|nr:undecaprenyldiphospho-muramoylpentapeptide beta-N-acetylglucosaminyltransferase [Bacillota bacterium]